MVDGAWAFVEEEYVGLPEHPYDVTFIAALAGKHPDERPPELRRDEHGPIIDIRSLHMSRVNLMLRMHSWSAFAYGIETDGVLRASLREPQVLDFSYATAPTALAGQVEFGKMHYDIVNLRANRFGQYPNAKDTMEFSALARSIDGARVQIAGRLAHLYE